MSVTSAISRQLAQFVEVKPATHTMLRGLEAAMAAAITMLALTVLFGPEYAFVGLSGAFLAFTGWDRPLLGRARILALLGIVYLAALAAGLLVAGHRVLSVLALALIGLVVSFWYHALIADPPGPMLLIAGASFATYVPATGIAPLTYLAVVLFGMVVSSLTCLIFQIPVRQIPLRDALHAVTEAINDLIRADASTTDRQELARLRDQAFAAHFHAQEVLVESTARDHPTTNRQRLDRQLHALHVRLIESVCRQETPWATVQVHLLLALPYLGAPSTGYLLRWAMSRASLPWLAARRMGMAILLVGTVTLLLDTAQPAWAIMTTAIILSFGVDRTSTTHRAGHRVVGTLLGLMVFLVIDTLTLHRFVLLCVIVGCIFLIQVLGPRNFALASMAITPMALFMFTGAHADANPAEIVTSRMTETVVGAVCALAVLWATGFSTPIALARRQFRRTLRALERTLDLYSNGNARSRIGFSARRNLHFEQLASAQVLDLARRDRPRALAGYSKVEAVTSDLTYVVLTAGWTAVPERTLDTAAMAEALRACLAKLPPVSSRPIDAVAVAGELARVLDIGQAGRGPGRAETTTGSLRVVPRPPGTGAAGVQPRSDQ